MFILDQGKYQCLVTAILLVAVAPGIIVAGQDICQKINSCSCRNSQGTIDLSPLDNLGGASEGGTPRFRDIPSSDATRNLFSWNPCTSFSEGGGSCTHVAVCKIQPGFEPAYLAVGYQHTADFETDNSSGLVTLKYTATTPFAIRNTYISLYCDEDLDPGEVTAEEESPFLPHTYELTYTGVYACFVDGQIFTHDNLTNVTINNLTNITDNNLTNITDNNLTNITGNNLTNITDNNLTNVTDNNLTNVTSNNLTNLTNHSLTNTNAIPLIDTILSPSVIPAASPGQDVLVSIVTISMVLLILLFIIVIYLVSKLTVRADCHANDARGTQKYKWKSSSKKPTLI